MQLSECSTGVASTPAYSPDDPQLVQAYRRDGVVCVRGVIDRDWLERLAAASAVAEQNGGPYHFRFADASDKGDFFGDVLVWQRNAEIRDFVFNGPLAPLSGRLMQSEQVVFYHDFLLIKNSGTSKATPWHQDQSYWCVGGDNALTIWAPLDPISTANTLRFVRGSHRDAPIYAAVPFDKGSTFDGSRDGRPAVPEVEAEYPAADILSWELQPGDVLIFHCRMLHAAPGNPLATPRRVLSTCWAGAGAHYMEIDSDLAPPVKGDGLTPGGSLVCKTFPQVLPRVLPAEAINPVGSNESSEELTA